MSTFTGNFFPPEYKNFKFTEGDLTVGHRQDGKFAVNKILKIDRFNFEIGSTINIQGQHFTVPEADHLLIIGVALGEAQFDSFKAASAAADSGEWKIKIAHVPQRPPGAAMGNTFVCNRPVLQSELEGYWYWRQAFDLGKAGVF